MESLFCCPVCGGILSREVGRYTCQVGHSFDIAREGYVNLLPANQQHSKAPGDNREMAAARTRFLEGGWYAPLREALCGLAAKLASAGRRGLVYPGSGGGRSVQGWPDCRHRPVQTRGEKGGPPLSGGGVRRGDAVSSPGGGRLH